MQTRAAAAKAQQVIGPEPSGSSGSVLRRPLSRTGDTSTSAVVAAGDAGAVDGGVDDGAAPTAAASNAYIMEPVRTVAAVVSTCSLPCVTQARFACACSHASIKRTLRCNTACTSGRVADTLMLCCS